MIKYTFINTHYLIMKKSILFLPASIRSHVVPALYLADLLGEEYDIYFAVTSEILGEIVKKQGHQALRTGNFRVALGMEGQYVFETKNKISKWETLKSVLNNELYDYRQKELSEFIDRITPSAIFIDIFNSTDLLVLYPKYKDIKLLFMNPMLSTYRVNGFPTVDEGYWPEKHLPEKSVIKKGIPFKYVITRPFEAIMTTALEPPV